ncbi:MAG TPA: 50S ribosomal protein L9 [Thermoclostridium sp.]|nr:50S ribosomal protein L9 [Thermoclostridium sp.]
MKVILKQDVKNIGKKDTLAEVSDGYARNFLIPKGLAVEASASKINEMKMRQGADKSRKENEAAKARGLAEKIKGVTVAFTSKAGESGKLFGSITSKDIADKLKDEQKVQVDRRKIVLPEAIKALGVYDIEIKLHAGISTNIKVEVVNEE